MSDTTGSPDATSYLQAIGPRVRGLRAGRGISRRTLAELTGVSERYLARLETGAANPSVEVLWRIAQALDVGVPDLLADRTTVSITHPPLLAFLQQLPPDEQATMYSVVMQHFSGQRSAYQGAVLIGLRGAGKSTLGRHLARTLGVRYLRLRDVIESLAGMPLSDVFSVGGQKAYRRLERQAVEHVAREAPGALLEAGGSIVSEPDTFHLLRGAFFTVWVRASADEHMRRVIAQGDLRPIQLATEAHEDLRQILAEREPYYNLANYVLNTTGREIDACAAELAQVCRPYLSVEQAA